MAKIWTQLKAIWKCIKGYFELTEEQLKYAEDVLDSLFGEKSRKESKSP